MNIHRIEQQQTFNLTIEDIWKFISTPLNLNLITPDDMEFKILTQNLPDEIYSGLIIQYTVKPLWNLRFNWVTEITAVEKNKYFIDEQRFGPYQFWHHEHFLFQNKNKVIMKDLVLYAIPYGLVGEILHKLIIRKRLEYIFQFRKQKLDEIFNQ